MSSQGVKDSGTVGAWKPTVAYYRSAVVAVGLIAFAVLFRRPDFLVLATPAAVVATWSVLTRPQRIPSVEDWLGHGTIREGDATSWQTDAKGDNIDLITVAVSDMAWIQRRPNKGSMTAATSDGVGSIRLHIRSMRWGRRDLEPLQVSAASAWGAFEYTAKRPLRSIVTLPTPARFDSSAPVRPTDGLVGSYRSVRPGEGSEFASVRAFQVGDRMRRINWNRSLRSDELQVNATWADQDTHVALVIDVGDDLGLSEGLEGNASSLDITVRAAGAIAEYYLRRGNRVSLRSFDPSVRIAIPPAAGQAHLRRVLDTLARVNAPVGRFSRSAGRTLSSAEVTVILSPLASSEAMERAVLLGRRGGAVVVVDTLPDHVTEADDPLLALAWRIRLLERRRELRLARERGIAVSQWSGPGSLDHFLRNVAQQASAPRIRS